MISIENASFGYPKTLVMESMNLRVAPGEMVGILGPNGSGKTTFLKAVSGTLPLNAGRIKVQGKDIAHMKPRQRARSMACVPQNLDMVFSIRAQSMVLMGRYPHASFWGGHTARDKDIVKWAMDKTNTWRLRNRFVNNLSGGERQRVVIARALAQEAPVLLLDEAVSGLDIGAGIEIYDLLRSLSSGGATVVSAIHDLNLAALYCQRLVFLKQGQIVADGPVERVFTSEIIQRIYNAKVNIFRHPDTGGVQCVPIPGHARGSMPV